MADKPVKKLSVGSDTFEYPITGGSNYGEEATAWASAVSDVLAQVSGPGDIPTTETVLVGTDNGDGTSTGLVSGLIFDTSFVQRIEIKGIITREYTLISGKSQEVESFVIEGAYNGTEFVITHEFAGDDTEVFFFPDGGQFKFTSVNVADTETLSTKFQAKVLIDEEAV